MNSSEDTVPKPDSTAVAASLDTPRSPSRPSSTAAEPSASKDAEPSSKQALTNGNRDHDDPANESEAETVVLDREETNGHPIKTEPGDDDDSSGRLRSVKDLSRTQSPATNGRSNSRDAKMNGVKLGSERDRDAKSSAPTSPSSRTTSRHTKDASPAGSATSPVRSADSPPQPTGRGRSASTLESRKRKHRDDAYPKALEPPRQRPKTEGLKDLRQPTSPATPGLIRPHKRSQSTQSLVSGAAGRKRRDTTALAVSTDRKDWSDDSSGGSSSPRPAQTPNLPHARGKRSGYGRTLTSPARTMAHGRKVDKFGATRLARESEKGDLAQVQAAYEAAREELDYPDFAGIAPLQKAALHGWADVVRYLIAQGCRTDCESNDRDTPLIDAVENGHLDVVKLLLHEGKVNPHHQNKKGQRAIDVLDNEADDAEEIEKELQAAMRKQVNTSNTEEYAQSGLSQAKSASRLLFNEYNTETLVEKAGDGDMAAVGELINSNIKPNIACGVAASRGGHYDILSILLASGLKADPDPSKHSETPMLVAIGRGHLRIVKLLLEQDNFDPTRRNREGKTYWEISEDRQGPKWEQERDILKQAYDAFRASHRSPRRTKKEPPNPNAIRAKRKSSPIRRERSSSPKTDTKRAPLSKSVPTTQAPQKARRLMSGKEMANRDVKRRRRVVNEESSDDSEDEVRAPSKKPAKPRSWSEGEETKPSKKTKPRLVEEDVPKRAHAPLHKSDDEPHPKSSLKPREKSEKSEKSHSAKPTPDPESPDEKKPIKTKVRSKTMEDVRNKKRRASNGSIDDSRVKKVTSTSAKSTPAPPEKPTTPDHVREQRQEEQKRVEKAAAEAKRKAAEEEARKHEEELARQVAEMEEAKRAEEELRKKAEAEAEAKRLAEEAETARIRAEEEARRRAEEEARQQELAARRERVLTLPLALRRACELGSNRPLHFAGEQLGISILFLPLLFATGQDLLPNCLEEVKNKMYIPSFQVVGILGLPELDLARLDAPYSSWKRISCTPKHRELLLRKYSVDLLAQDFRFPPEGAQDFDYAKIKESISNAREQFLSMEGLYWVEDELLYPEVEKVEKLRPLLTRIKDTSQRNRICFETDPETPRPKKTFMDVALAQISANAVKSTTNNDPKAITENSDPKLFDPQLFEPRNE